MSHDLLRSWLKITGSSWPPDHYALLGLRPGEGGTDEIEKRVLERMDLLRRYQLLHPEQVTEGMNRLAQAMNCLLDADSRKAYDAKLNLVPPPLPKNLTDSRPSGIPALTQSSSPTTVDKSSRATAVRDDQGRPIEKFYSPGDQPPPVEKFYSLGDEPPGGPRPIRPELIEDEDEPLQIEHIEEFEESFDEEAPRRARRRKGYDPEERRTLYAELARIRRVMRIWQLLRQSLTDPEKAFNRRAETVGFMSALSDLRALLPTVEDLVGGTDQPGHLVATLSKQNLVVEMFRSLLPSQREALAQDCRAGHFRLSQRYDDIRAEIRLQTTKSFARLIWFPMLRELGRSPEWIMLGLGCAALVIALIRSLPDG
jgi:hypothetical protein